jgi:hypothetical protein
MSIYVQRVLCDTYDATVTKTYVALSENTYASDKNIETTGSSATVTAVDSLSSFALLNVGDVIYVPDVVATSGVISTRTLIAKASANSVTVDAAVNLDIDGGYPFRWKKLQSGTAATDGLVNVSGWKNIVVHSNVETYNAATNITVSVEGIPAGGTTPVALLDPAGAAAANVHTGTGAKMVEVRSSVESLRVGLQVNGADSGLNQVTVWVGGYIEPLG